MLEENIKRDFRVIVGIADVHIGNKALSPSETKYQLKHGLIEQLENLSFCDGIVIAGDTTHCQISMNSEYADVFSWFISKIIKIARSHNAFVRIIKGTKSHDLDQLETIRHYEYDFDLDFKIINECTTENIYGMNMAYIPEDYIKDDPTDYYKEVFKKPEGYFDMIFMHGLIEPCRFTNQISENLDSSAPIFKLNSFYKVCRGPILGGHIHTPMVFNNKFYYIGSQLQTCHGEFDPKGFDVVIYVPDLGLYRVERFINKYTLNFDTLKIDNKFIEDKEAEEIVEYVNDYIRKKKIDRLSIKFVVIDSEKTMVKIELLKKYFSKNNNITISFKILTEQSYEQESKGYEKKEKASYLADGLDIVDRIQLWAKEKRNVQLSREDIVKYITASVTLQRKEALNK